MNSKKKLVLPISPSPKELIPPPKAPIPLPFPTPSGGGGTKVIDTQAKKSLSSENIIQQTIQDDLDIKD